MIKGRYVATLIIDIHASYADFNEARDSIKGKEFTDELRKKIYNLFRTGVADVELTPQHADVYEVNENAAN